ncbi:MAG: NADH:flavin oxidoreductase, partial [Gemmatimonadales bacterium]
MKKLKHVLQPLRVKSMELPNRVVMPPMGTGLANPDHSVSDATIAYITRRARGGAGLVITEIVSVHPDGAGGPAVLGAWDDKFIPGMTRLAEAVHSVGNKVAMQFYHCGRESPFQLARGTAVSASAIPSDVIDGTPRELTRDEIGDLVAGFGAAAARAKKAGFAAVDVHGAHGYLLCQFLSAHSNQRTDEYGGSLKD